MINTRHFWRPLYRTRIDYLLPRGSAQSTGHIEVLRMTATPDKSVYRSTRTNGRFREIRLDGMLSSQTNPLVF